MGMYPQTEKVEREQGYPHMAFIVLPHGIEGDEILYQLAIKGQRYFL